MHPQAFQAVPSLYWQQTIALVPSDSITFEIELIRQVEINIDYILMLVMKYHESNCKDKSILGTIDRAIDSSIQRLAQFFEKYFGI